MLVLWLGATPELYILLKAAVLARPGPAVSRDPWEGTEWADLEKAEECRKRHLCEQTDLHMLCSTNPLKRPLVELSCVTSALL